MKRKLHYFHYFLLVVLIALGAKWSETEQAAGWALQTAAFVTLLFAAFTGYVEPKKP